MQDTFIQFPDPSSANIDGLLAMGGDLRPDTLVRAYTQGIFPWFNDDQPILWWSPDPRLVLYPSQFKVTRSLLKSIRNGGFTVTANTCFNRVLDACASRGLSATATDIVPASIESDDFYLDQDGKVQMDPTTWITEDMHAAYRELHALGIAHSVEVWHEQQLVGGLYGVKLGQIFYGESMFSVVSNTSKVASAYLCAWARSADIHFIDCQIHSNHLASLGAIEIPREEFLRELKTHTSAPESDGTRKLNIAFGQLTPEKVTENVIKKS
ncbi:MAG TPA: leucyl/phenylalanyl-tRNA--protein transferase [Gammaproteobacteria bacterium]|nr:leucyl/phenylalanyl-tRNA--protein transferase [Gammaproteobacteria bacterium]